MKKYILVLLIISICCSCSQPIARKPISIQSGSNIKESLILNTKIKDREEKYIKNIILKDTTHEYLNSGNGFWYYYTKKDSISGKKPAFGNQVHFDYTIKNINGAYIYPPNKFKNQEYRIDKEELFFGLREGIKLLQEGESATFLFPSHLAFGFYGDLQKIGRNTPIISEVTVNSIFEIKN